LHHCITGSNSDNSNAPTPPTEELIRKSTEFCYFYGRELGLSSSEKTSDARSPSKEIVSLKTEFTKQYTPFFMLKDHIEPHLHWKLMQHVQNKHLSAQEKQKAIDECLRSDTATELPSPILRWVIKGFVQKTVYTALDVEAIITNHEQRRNSDQYEQWAIRPSNYLKNFLEWNCIMKRS
jgi:hypothetical protein